MLGPNAVCSRIFLALLILTLSYFAYMNYILFIRVRDYPIRRETNVTSGLPEYKSRISCDINPICDVTVKGMMMDNPNHYLLTPLATITDRALGISDQSWISPNAISAFHVLVAMAAGKCVSSDSLSERRFGVVLFMIRSWLDDLDGHVARQRKNIRGEHSEFGSLGYWIDGLCDFLGVTFLLIGIYYFMKTNPPRRGYQKLLPTQESGKEFKTGIVYKKKILSGREAPKTLLFIIGQLILSSAGWNRYISLYQDLLESEISSTVQLSNENSIQTIVFRSASFWAITLSWTIVNFHAITDYLLLAIFTDRLWEYFRSVRYVGYIFLIIVIGASEFHYRNVYACVLDSTITPSVSVSETINYRRDLSFILSNQNYETLA
ncbi:ceramide phosphoethanolamine synthase [Athalia rosae]|uniref:ceramide phosphoethanolamine synthase n=1 Tax=Athalia rosae TaxID=37344 RepID=UPI0020332092|nr:ceramide phosphoethanolamine synthase [Athalia rosae]